MCRFNIKHTPIFLFSVLSIEIRCHFCTLTGSIELVYVSLYFSFIGIVLKYFCSEMSSSME